MKACSSCIRACLRTVDVENPHVVNVRHHTLFLEEQISDIRIREKVMAVPAS